jgi:AraC-like DNA-binding protein
MTEVGDGPMTGADDGPERAAARTMGKGVLRPQEAAEQFTLRRHEPPADLAPFLDYFWIVRWDLQGQPFYDQRILPHPNVNLAFDDTGAAVYGVDTKIFTRRITGTGKVLGVRFRPGGFRPFGASAVSELNDRVVPASEFFGPPAEATCRDVMAATADEAMIAPAADLLRAAAPPPDPVAKQVAAIVARITSDQALRRVSQLTEVCGISERTLQRMFGEYVGVSPKWVLRRARLHEAALRADAGDEIDWAHLAASLGYADQAHLTRDFTATIGMSPARYAGT